MDDLKKQIDTIVKKINKDADFKTKFMKDPVKAIESVTGLDLPDDKINSIVDGVKAKLTLDQAGDLFDQVKGIFGKK